MPFASERGEPHLLEHVEVVVRRGAVRADTDRNAKLQHLRNRRHAGTQLEVARRIVRHAGTGVLQRAHLTLVDVHAVSRQHPRVEQPLLLHPRHNRHAVIAS